MKDLTGKGKPFHSALDKAAGLLKRKVGTGAEFMKELMALPGIKQTEIQERGLGEVLGMPRMTHDQFMETLNAKPAPAIRQITFGEEPSPEDVIRTANQDTRAYAKNYADQANTSQGQRMLMNDEIRRLRGKHRETMKRSAKEALTSKTEHEEWTLPGGENYREILIKAPENVDNRENIMELDAKLRRAPPGIEREALYRQLNKVLSETKEPAPINKEQFEGVQGHFGGEPGILASMRVKDRTGPNGEKLLHLEELQSDWHQQGREHGYKDPQAEQKLKQADELKRTFDELNKRRRILHEQALREPDAGPRFDSLMEEANGITPKLLALNSQMHDLEHFKRQQQNAIPDAPFKKNWEEMALKRLIHHAAENGYHGIVVTPGAEQADRYSLAQHVDEISHYPRTDARTGEKSKSVRIDMKNGNPVQLGVNQEGIVDNVSNLEHENFKGKHISDIVGKEHAKNIMGAERGLISGEGLTVGGEGMKGFYDKKVPNILNSIGKKYGVKTELNGHKLVTKEGSGQPTFNFRGEQSGNVDYPEESKQLHHFPITEDMRKDITTNGLPLYAEGGIIRKAEGGNVQPSLAQMKLALGSKGTPPNIKDVGINEAINLAPKVFLPPDRGVGGMPAPGGVATRSGMPIGGIDMSQMNPGQQLMPQPQQPQQAQQGAQPPQGGLAPQGGAQGPQGPTPPMGNMLSMTPQGQALGAMGGAPAQGLAKGGQPSVDSMKAELAAKKTKKAVAPVADEGDDDEEEPPVTSKRITIKAEGPGGVTGIVVPHHMLHGRSWISKKTGKKVVVPGMASINKARAEVYGSENRNPLSIGQIGKIHKDTLTEHFAKSPKDQLAAEKEAMQRLRDAKHLGAKNNTLDESEKLDTVRHETDEQGRTHVGFASKGVAGHALYMSGHGDNMKYHVINTCPGQTEGCGGGKDSEGVVDTSKGTCFAPGAESQYVHAAVRRACHEQAKHDPAMTRDWILSHTGSIRDAVKKSDKNNQRLLFRPNVVDETDVSSRHVIRHLNEQRKAEDKPPIIANSYGKTNELHDPENGYHVTHSNVGPKVKKGESIAENIGRDKARVRNTIMAADNKGDFKNEQGNKTPPKGSYMVTDVKRGSPMAEKMEGAITHAKYWTTGRAEHELSEAEKAEGPEGHFGGNGKSTSEDKAHYGHKTVGGQRFDYQRQHILHPRLVNVPIRKKNKNTGEMETKDHMIPTDSRFKDTEFLPEKRFKTKNGKEAGHILMTTPTESTSNLGHETSFTHHVNQKHVEHALANKGEYEIDKPEDQIKAAGKEYRQSMPIKLPSTMKLAEGGSVTRHHGFSEDDYHAFPESNLASQRHLAMRRGDDEEQAKYHSPKKQVAVHKNMDTMRLELTRKK